MKKIQNEIQKIRNSGAPRGLSGDAIPLTGVPRRNAGAAVRPRAGPDLAGVDRSAGEPSGRGYASRGGDFGVGRGNILKCVSARKLDMFDFDPLL